MEGRTATLLLPTGKKSAKPASPERESEHSASNVLSASLPAFPERQRDALSLQATLGWATLGLGVAGLATWGVTGVIAMDRHKSLQAHCPNDECSPAYQRDLDHFRAYRAASSVGFFVGALGVATGAVLVFTAPRGSHQRRMGQSWHGWVSPSGMGLGASY
jgi:hypothetical protein